MGDSNCPVPENLWRHGGAFCRMKSAFSEDGHVDNYPQIHASTWPVAHELAHDAGSSYWVPLAALEFTDIGSRLALTTKSIFHRSREHATLVYLLSSTGLRWGEATAIHVRSIDISRRRI
jgi:hypothetical protein